MPETYKRCSVWEVAISTRTKSQGVEEGDIVAVRPDGRGCIGIKEMREFVWVRVHGWDDAQMARLTDYMGDGKDSGMKRRFALPLERIRRVMGGAVARMRSRTDAYQPYLVSAEPEWITVSDGVQPVGPGLIRLSVPEPIVVKWNTASSERSPQIDALRVPSGYTWQFLWGERMGMTRDQLKAEFGTTRWALIREWLRQETRRMKVDGPLIEIRNPQGRLETPVVSSTLTALCGFPGECLACAPPLELAGLVYDKARMRMIERL